MLTHWNN